LLILALVLLLILCWRLRSKHQATKEQLAHCQERDGSMPSGDSRTIQPCSRQDELFTRPQTSKQEKQEQRAGIWCQSSVASCYVAIPLGVDGDSSGLLKKPMLMLQGINKYK